jgi:hypothetical protein
LITYVRALRGDKRFMLDAFGLRNHTAKQKYDRKHPHRVAPMLGWFKGEDRECLHLLLLVEKSKSELHFRLWLERLVHLLDFKGQEHGPAFCDEEGNLEKWVLNEDYILNELLTIQDEDTMDGKAGERIPLLPADLDVKERIGIARIFQWRATSRARVAELSKKDIDVICWWGEIERAKGMQPSSSMQEYYTQVELTRELSLNFSKAR